MGTTKEIMCFHIKEIFTSYALIVIFATFWENQAFAVEDLENTKEIHEEEADTPMILLSRNSHSGNIHLFPSCHFWECA